MTYLRLTDQSAARLARAVGVSRGYITHVIHGRRCPEGLLRKLAAHTGIPYSRLHQACVKQEAA